LKPAWAVRDAHQVIALYDDLKQIHTPISDEPLEVLIISLASLFRSRRNISIGHFSVLSWAKMSVDQGMPQD